MVSLPPTVTMMSRPGVPVMTSGPGVPTIVGVLPLHFGTTTRYGHVTDALLPARSYPVSVTDLSPAVAVSAAAPTVAAAGCDNASVTFALTAAPSSPSANVGRAMAHVTVGGTVSRLRVIDLLAVPPDDVAVHVSVWPFVSAMIVVGSQPSLESIGDSASVTLQLTDTSERYQPLLAVPATFGLTTGGE